MFFSFETCVELSIMQLQLENRIWKLQQCRQVPMNLITLTSILNACEPGGRWDLALEQL